MLTKNMGYICLQKEISNALHKAGINISVQTDFDALVEHIDEQPAIWQSLLDNNSILSSVAPNLEKLKQSLSACDTDVLERVRNAQRVAGIDIRLKGNKIQQWIFEVQNKLRELGLNVERKFSDKEDWHNNVDSLNFTTTNPKVMTYHSAKGLQFETVFLPMISDCIVNSDRKALYVAMTRTCRNLYIMYSGNMPSPLDTIPSSLYKTVVTDEIEDI